MNKTLSRVLSILLCVIIITAVVTGVIAAVQIVAAVRDELQMAWAIAAAILLPLVFLIGLGIWTVVSLIKNVLS